MTEREWERLRLLRESFHHSGKSDWDVELIQLYDRTLGERIRWKWQNVLSELKNTSIPENPHIIDWGTGSGVAITSFLDWLENPCVVQLVDRSRASETFVKNMLSKKNVEVDEGPLLWQNSVVLLSHVVNELNQNEMSDLISNLKMASVVIWVEPGEKRAASRLVKIREKLMGHLYPIMPCTHQSSCPLNNQPHKSQKEWCHFFGRVPSYVFQDPFYQIMSVQLGFDMRSLPISFLVLSKDFEKRTELEAARVIGRPRIRKGHVLVNGCDLEGYFSKTISRKNPEFRELQKEKFNTLVTR